MSVFPPWSNSLLQYVAYDHCGIQRTPLKSILDQGPFGWQKVFCGIQFVHSMFLQELLCPIKLIPSLHTYQIQHELFLSYFYVYKLLSIKFFALQFELLNDCVTFPLNE